MGTKSIAYKDVKVRTQHPGHRSGGVKFTNVDSKKDKVHNFKTGKKEKATWDHGKLRFDK